MSKGLNTSHIYGLITACADLADWIRLHHPQHVRPAENSFLTAWDKFHDSQTQNRYRRSIPKPHSQPDESLRKVQPGSTSGPDPIPTPDEPQEPTSPPPT